MHEWKTRKTVKRIGKCFLLIGSSETVVVSIRLFLTFCSFSYNGVYYDVLKLSVCEVIVTQKGSNGEGKSY